MAAADQITFTLRKDRWKEESRVVIVARFRDRATQDEVTPTNVYYRLDCLSTGKELLDWTSVSTGETVTITVTPAQNEIQYDGNRMETKQLTVAADYELSTQFVESLEYEIENVRGFN